MSEYKNLIITLVLFLIGQSLIWFQANSQFLWSWAKDNPIILSLLGIPISYIFIWGTRYAYLYFDGLLWPIRFVGFSTGTLIVAMLTYQFFGEGISLKTGVSLILALIIMIIQIFWK